MNPEELVVWKILQDLYNERSINLNSVRNNFSSSDFLIIGEGKSDRRRGKTGKVCFLEVKRKTGNQDFVLANGLFLRRDLVPFNNPLYIVVISSDGNQFWIKSFREMRRYPERHLRFPTATDPNGSVIIDRDRGCLIELLPEKLGTVVKRAIGVEP